MTELEKDQSRKIIGRTWADIFANGFFWIFILILIFILGYFGVFKTLTFIPIWFWYSVAMSLIFTPFMFSRAKDDASLVVVLDGDQNLTEYRIGKRYNWEIIGEPLYFTSNSGVKRLLLSKLDTNTGKGEGLEIAGFTQFDLARDLSVFKKLSTAFSEHLRKERLTKESIAVEVEKRVNDISNRYLNILYGSLDPSELENALNISNSYESINIDDALEGTLNE